MKKLERLTLKELGNSVNVLDREESIGLKGGDDNGASAYYLIYFTQLPEGTGYDVVTDTCYPLSLIPGPYNYQNPEPTFVIDKTQFMLNCTKCPPNGTGPDGDAGYGEGKGAFRMGVYLNHVLSGHDQN